MKRIALAILLTCTLGAGLAAGGKGSAKGKSGALLGAAPANPQPVGGRSGGAVVLGSGVVAGRTLYADPRQVPPLDPERSVSEQDCTKPVDLMRGNLKCK
jgi:hypothetical protein